MLDAGLRVSEVCTLRLNNFDFKKKLLKPNSLKKRGSNEIRLIPISDRLYRELANHIDKIKNPIAESPLFKGKAGREFISRIGINNFLKRYQKNLGFENFSPHSLRHSFATHHLAAGTPLEDIKTMLGHKRFDTTLIYTQIPTERLIEQVNKVTTKPKKKWLQRLFSLTKRRKTKMVNLNFNKDFYTIGRNEEIANLEVNAQKGVNTIVKGSIGVGKSHLLEIFQSQKRILRLDDTESIKKSIANILIYLHKSKEAVFNLIWKDFTIDEIEKRIQRENTNSLCELLISSVEPKEFILLIDDISKITPTGKKVLERLKDAFVIIAGARYIKANDTSFLWNFEVIEIKPLKRHFAMTMINQISSGMEIENWELYRNHIFNQTNGNPRAITELVERYQKEPFLTNEIVKEVRHMGALKEIDMTWILILFLGVLMATRYMAGEMEEPALKFIGGVAMILLLMYRPLQRTLQRKFL